MAVSGLSLSNENYELAVRILKERFGDVQDVVNTHYSKLINMQKAMNTTSSLRTLLDTVERHVRSQEVLKQDINQDMFVCMIRSKLSEDVLLQLEIQKGSKSKWTVSMLLERLHDYVTSHEHSETKREPVHDHRKQAPRAMANQI